MDLSLEVPTSDPLSKIEEQIEGFEPSFGPSKIEALSNLEDAKAEETQFSAPTSLRDGVTPFNSGEDWTMSDAQEFPEETKDSVTEVDADLLVLSDSSMEDLSPSQAKEKLSRIEPLVEVLTHETIPGQFVQVVKESILNAYNLFDEMPRKKSIVLEPSKTGVKEDFAEVDSCGLVESRIQEDIQFVPNLDRYPKHLKVTLDPLEVDMLKLVKSSLDRNSTNLKVIPSSSLESIAFHIASVEMSEWIDASFDSIELEEADLKLNSIEFLVTFLAHKVYAKILEQQKGDVDEYIELPNIFGDELSLSSFFFPHRKNSSSLSHRHKFQAAGFALKGPPSHTKTKRILTSSIMSGAGDVFSKEAPLGVDSTMEEESTSLSKLLLEFTNIASVDKAWTFKSGKDTSAMFSITQPNLLANKRRKFLMSSYITKEGKGAVAEFQWSKFPVEMSGVSTMVPSPSGSKLLVVRNPENDSPTKFEIWNQSHVEMEFHIPQTVHGSVYADGWFEGVSWNSDETLIAYVAEEPSPPKPTFNNFGYKNGGSSDKDSNSWKGQGDWEEGWGETYVNKRRPTVFVIDVKSGEVHAVKGIKRSLSAGQVVWAPSGADSLQGLVFVGWSSEKRKLGIKYCYNRPCALYFVQCQFGKSEANESATRSGASTEDTSIVNLTEGMTSAFFPRFSSDEKSLVFVSAKSAVDSGAHSATNSLHRMDWPSDSKEGLSQNITDVVPVVMCPKDSSFPGLYCSTFLTNPWLSDGRSMILSSMWGSSQVILSVDTHSGSVTRVTPPDPGYSWNLLGLDEDNIIAVCSSLVDVPQIKYGCPPKESSTSSWTWQDVPSPTFRCSTKVKSLVSALQCSILKIPVKNVSENSAQGANQPFEAIFVSSKEKKSDPLIVVLHGGPHSAYSTAFSKPLAFLSSVGYNLLLVNYRGSLGFGEEALQSLPGKVGSQDVNDVLTSLDYVIEMKLASPSKIAVLGGSHGGFLTTHLIGQAPERFAAAAARNPVCNMQLMVGTTDIPDWCFVESYGTDGKSRFTEAPSMEQLDVLHQMSPISHINKVKTPTLFLIGAQDLRVPSSNGLQYARALQERGVEVKTIVFPEDTHGIERPQSDFESFLNIGVWFNKYCK